MIVVCGGDDSIWTVFADDFEEELVNTSILREFGVEGGGQHPAGTDKDGITVPAGEDLDTRAEAADAWGADEDHLHGAAGEGGFGVKDDGVVLAAVGIPLDIDIQHAKAALRRVGDVLCQENTAGTGAKDGLRADEGVQDGVEARALQVLEEGGGLAAREDEGVQRIEFLGLTDQVRGGTELGKTLRVDVEGALECKDADTRGVLAHPLRVAVRCECPKVLLPTIGGFAYRFAREKNH